MPIAGLRHLALWPVMPNESLRPGTSLPRRFPKEFLDTLNTEQMGRGAEGSGE